MGEEEDKEKLFAQLKVALRRVLDEKAYERMMNVLLVNQNLFAAASQKLLTFYQKTGRTMGEKEVLVVLNALKESPKTGGISIKRK